MNYYGLFMAIVAIESNGDVNAVGDNGKAVGPAQIHEAVVKDCNRIAKAKFTMSDRESMLASFDMFIIYVEHYGHKYGDITPEIAARIWNGGPNGPDKQATLNYWNKVNSKLISP
jgi:hypothetical protein